jgi:CDI toxin RNase A-like protein
MYPPAVRRRVLVLGLAALMVGAASAPRRDLGLDESRGGHTLARHVGRTDSQLLERLAREPRISAASTYTDRATAELLVGLALERERNRLDAWRRREGSRPNLVLHVDAPRGPPIGRVMHRGSRQSVPATSALVVLRWNEGLQQFYVLTSYPEARE